MKHSTAVALLLSVAVLAALGWSTHGWGQEKMPRVGILATPVMTGGNQDAVLEWYEPFRRALAQRGWIEGKGVSFEYRSAIGNPPRYDEAAAELVRLKVDVIYANNAPATR